MRSRIQLGIAAALSLAVFYFPLPLARASNPHTEAIVEYIKANDFTMRLGDAYVLVLDPVEHRTIIRYDPETATEPEKITVTNRGKFVRGGKTLATCFTTMVDVGLVGDIGPRDGFTRCEGYLGAADLLGTKRPKLYHTIMTELFAAAAEIIILTIPRDSPTKTPKGREEPI